MTPTPPWEASTALLAVACLHAGFQVTVTLAVYPALAATPSASWGAVHDAHSRRMVVLVAPLYGLLLLASAHVLLAGPGAADWVALGGLAVALGTTAAVAAPLHGRLGEQGPRPDLLRRLLAWDRVRCAGALVGLAGAVVAATR